MAARILINFNELTDVVSVYIDGTSAAKVLHAPKDNHILLELDTAGHVVGVEVFGASTIVPAFWKEHPDRAAVPAELLVELDRWLAHHWADGQAG
jgi:uncharacterized protein YuzE